MSTKTSFTYFFMEGLKDNDGKPQHVHVHGWMDFIDGDPDAVWLSITSNGIVSYPEESKDAHEFTVRIPKAVWEKILRREEDP